jgi:F-type H+-transporting ATPase subunit b
MQINLTPDPSLLAIMVIFLLNYLVVRTFFLKPINNVIEARETEVKTAERLYEESLARFNEATSQTEAQLHAARREAAQVRDKFRAEAAAHRAQLVDKTQGEAQQIVQAADAKLSEDVKVARDKIVSQSEQLAKLAAERILGRPV